MGRVVGKHDMAWKARLGAYIPIPLDIVIEATWAHSCTNVLFDPTLVSFRVFDEILLCLGAFQLMSVLSALPHVFAHAEVSFQHPLWKTAR